MNLNYVIGPVLYQTILKQHISITQHILSKFCKWSSELLLHVGDYQKTKRYSYIQLQAEQKISIGNSEMVAAQGFKNISSPFILLSDEIISALDFNYFTAGMTFL